MLLKKLSVSISLILIILIFLAACTSQAPISQDSAKTKIPERGIGTAGVEEETLTVPTEEGLPSQNLPDLTGEMITVYHIGDLTGPTG